MVKKILLIKRGFLKTCPYCGKSKIFSSYLKLTSVCKNKNCKFVFKNYKTEDGPAYFTIFIVGHIIIPIIVLLEGLEVPPHFGFKLPFGQLLQYY